MEREVKDKVKVQVQLQVQVVVIVVVLVAVLYTRFKLYVMSPLSPMICFRLTLGLLLRELPKLYIFLTHSRLHG